MTIQTIGTIEIPQEILDHAETIKHENYKVNRPGKFQKHSMNSEAGRLLTKRIAEMVDQPEEKIDWVYFSCSQGAEPHVDELDPNIFTNNTYVVPIVLPHGETTLHTETDRKLVSKNEMYWFDHTKTHSMRVEDISGGCVVLMAGILV